MERGVEGRRVEKKSSRMDAKELAAEEETLRCLGSDGEKGRLVRCSERGHELGCFVWRA